jgi:hypothetical protein
MRPLSVTVRELALRPAPQALPPASQDGNGKPGNGAPAAPSQAPGKAQA